jgi:gas vesicle protein
MAQEPPKETTPEVKPVPEAANAGGSPKFSLDDMLASAKDILGKLQAKGSAAAADMQEELKELQAKIADEKTRDAYKAKATNFFGDLKGKFGEFADEADDEIKEKFADVRKEFDEKMAAYKSGKLMDELKADFTETVADAKEEIKEFAEDLQETLSNWKEKLFGGGGDQPDQDGPKAA